MIKSSKRIVSIVLSLIMIISMLTVAVLPTTAATTEVQDTGATVTFDGTERIYFGNNDDNWWFGDGSYLFVYFFGTGDAWAEMKGIGNDDNNTNTTDDGGVYYVDVPAGTWTNFIMLRRSEDYSGWNDGKEQNRTGDISIPLGVKTTGNKLDDYSQNGTGGTWSRYAVAPTGVTGEITSANIISGDGSEATPYVVPTGSTFNLQGTATFNDSNMTGVYSFTGASGTYNETNSMSITASAVEETTEYTIHAKGRFGTTDTTTSTTSKNDVIYVQTVSAGHDVTATVSPEGVGSVSVNGTPITAETPSVSVPDTETATFEATVVDGKYAFLGWYNTSGEEVSTANPYTTADTISADLTLEARFEKVGFDVSATVSPEGVGSVSVNGTPLTTETTSVGVLNTETATFEATVVDGKYAFLGWYNTSGDQVSTANPYTTADTISSDLTLEARFEKVGYDVSATVSPDGAGSVSVNDTPITTETKSVVVLNTQYATFEATVVDSNYVFIGWYNADGNKVSSASSYTTDTMISADLTLEARFAEKIGRIYIKKDWIGEGVNISLDGSADIAMEKLSDDVYTYLLDGYADTITFKSTDLAYQTTEVALTGVTSGQMFEITGGEDTAKTGAWVQGEFTVNATSASTALGTATYLASITSPTENLEVKHSTVTFTATINENFESYFLGWYDATTDALVSTDLVYQTTLTGDMDLEAKFQQKFARIYLDSNYVTNWGDNARYAHIHGDASIGGTQWTGDLMTEIGTGLHFYALKGTSNMVTFNINGNNGKQAADQTIQDGYIFTINTNNSATGNVQQNGDWTQYEYPINVTILEDGMGSYTITQPATLPADLQAMLTADKVGLKGSTVKLTAISADNDLYEFVGWFLPGVGKVADTLEYEVTVAGDVDVEARFMFKGHDASATVDQAGAGSVSVNGTEITDTTTEVRVPNGQDAVFTQVTNQGYVFAGWYTADGATLLTEEEIYTVTALATNLTVMAKYDKITYTPPTLDYSYIISQGKSVDIDGKNYYVYDKGVEIKFSSVTISGGTKQIGSNPPVGIGESTFKVYYRHTNSEGVVVDIPLTTRAQYLDMNIWDVWADTSSLPDIPVGEEITLVLKAYPTEAAYDEESYGVAPELAKVYVGYEEKYTAPTTLTYDVVFDGVNVLENGINILDANANVTFNNIQASGSTLQAYIGDNIVNGYTSTTQATDYEYDIYWKDYDVIYNPDGTLLKTAVNNTATITAQELQTAGVNVNDNDVYLYVVARAVGSAYELKSTEETAVRIIRGLEYEYTAPTRVTANPHTTANLNGRFNTNQPIDLNVNITGGTFKYVVKNADATGYVYEGAAQEYTNYTYNVYDGTTLIPNTTFNAETGLVTIPAEYTKGMVEGKKLSLSVEVVMNDDTSKKVKSTDFEITMQSPFQITYDEIAIYETENGEETYVNDTNTDNPDIIYEVDLYKNNGTYRLSIPNINGKFDHDADASTPSIQVDKLFIGVARDTGDPENPEFLINPYDTDTQGTTDLPHTISLDLDPNTLKSGETYYAFVYYVVPGDHDYGTQIRQFVFNIHENSLNDITGLTGFYDGNEITVGGASYSLDEITEGSGKGTFIFNTVYAGGTPFTDAKPNAQVDYTYTLTKDGATTIDDAYVEIDNDGNIKFNIATMVGATESTDGLPLDAGVYEFVLTATHGTQVKTSSVSFTVTGELPQFVDEHDYIEEGTDPAYPPQGPTVGEGETVTIFVSSPSNWSSKIKYGSINFEGEIPDGGAVVPGVFEDYTIVEGTLVAGEETTSSKAYYVVKIPYDKLITKDDIAIGNELTLHGEGPDIGKVWLNATFYPMRDEAELADGVLYQTTNDENDPGSVVAPYVTSFTYNNADTHTISDITNSMQLSLRAILNDDNPVYSETEYLETFYYINGVKHSTLEGVAGTDKNQTFNITDETGNLINGFQYGTNYISVTVGIDSGLAAYESRVHKVFTLVIDPQNPEITNYELGAGGMQTITPQETVDVTTTDLKEGNVITVSGKYLEKSFYEVYDMAGDLVATKAVAPGATGLNVQSADITVEGLNEGQYLTYKFYNYDSADGVKIAETFTLKVTQGVIPEVSADNAMEADLSVSLLKGTETNTTFVVIGANSYKFRDDNVDIPNGDVTERLLENGKTEYVVRDVAGTLSVIDALNDDTLVMTKEQPVWETAYFMITDDMAKIGVNQWDDDDLRVSASIGNNTDVGSIVNTAITDVTPTDLIAFGTKYELDGKIYKVYYRDDVTDIKFYVNNSPVSSVKLSTSSIATIALETTEDEKLVYIQDYTAYDNTTVPSESIIFNLQNSLSLVYRDTQMSNISVGTNMITRTANVYTSADIRKFAVVESKYNEYAFDFTAIANGEHLTADLTLTATDTVRGFSLDIPVELEDPRYVSPAVLQAMSDISIYAVSTEERTSNDPSITYDIYNSGITSVVAHNGQYSASIRYNYVAWVTAPESVEVDGTTHNFVGWYNTVERIYVSQDAEYKFVVTQNTSIVPIYDDNPAISLSVVPYALVGEPLYETFVDGETPKVKITYPITFFAPESANIDEYKVSYQLTGVNDAYSLDKFVDYATISEANINAQGRVNFSFTLSIYDTAGNPREYSLYLHPYVNYNTDKTTKGDTKAIARATTDDFLLDY